MELWLPVVRRHISNQDLQGRQSQYKPLCKSFLSFAFSLLSD